MAKQYVLDHYKSLILSAFKKTKTHTLDSLSKEIGVPRTTTRTYVERFVGEGVLKADYGDGKMIIKAAKAK